MGQEKPSDAAMRAANAVALEAGFGLDIGSEMDSREVLALARVIDREMAPQWIPVGERLPRDHVDVLVFSSGGDVYVDWLTCNPSYGPQWASGNHVTHWMPIPPLRVTGGIGETQWTPKPSKFKSTASPAN